MSPLIELWPSHTHTHRHPNTHVHTQISMHLTHAQKEKKAGPHEEDSEGGRLWQRRWFEVGFYGRNRAFLAIGKKRDQVVGRVKTCVCASGRFGQREMSTDMCQLRRK